MTGYFKTLLAIHSIVFLVFLLAAALFQNAITIGLCAGYGLSALGALAATWNRE